MANYTDTTMMTELRAECPNAPDIVLQNALRWCCRDFCNRTTLYRQALTAINLVINQQSYAIAYPTDLELVALVSAQQNGLPLDIERYQDMQALNYNWQSQTGQNLLAVFMLDSGDIGVFPLPGNANAIQYPLNLYAALRPTANSATFPAVLETDWPETIRAGALMHLLEQVNQPWTDLQMALEKRALYLSGRADAAIQMARGFSTQPKIARVPFFAGNDPGFSGDDFW